MHKNNTFRALSFTFLFLGFILSGCSKGCKQEDESPPAENATQTTSTEQSAAQTPPSPSTEQTGTTTSAALPDLSIDKDGLSKATAVLKTSKGVIKFKFYTNDAPKSVARFTELVRQKFYDGLTFHRVVPGFVVQTGDPNSKNKNERGIGNGGSGQKLNAEFNKRKHIRGTVALARASDPNSADSQFYITMNAFPDLDEKYTVIGQVVDFGEKNQGKDTLDKIIQSDEIVSLTLE